MKPTCDWLTRRNRGWQSRSHFFGVAAHLMRQILVDHARRRRAGKRAGSKVRVSLGGGGESSSLERSRELVALDSSLDALERLDPRKCKAVELRYFGGLSMDEIAHGVMNVSAVTVRRDLRMAEAWLLERNAETRRCHLTPERWAQIEELFHRAAECEPDNRNCFAGRKCAMVIRLCDEKSRHCSAARRPLGRSFLKAAREDRA